MNLRLNLHRAIVAVTGVGILLASQGLADTWTIDSNEDWNRTIESSRGVTIANGLASTENDIAHLTTKIRRFSQKKQANTLVISQSPIWQNWNPTTNIGPTNLQDAPVLLTLGPNDYWIFGRYGKPRGRDKPRHRKFKSEPTRLDGFDMPLQTTPYANQFNAAGGLQPEKGGYHAWQSHDMKNWVHHGPVTEAFSKWVTNAEYIDGKTLIYYDFPNDQDPHVYIDENLFDGKPGENLGLAVSDPSHGSDAGLIRDLDGRMHVILEDWSPISADKRSWDSPLAAHAVSETGTDGFIFKKPPVDKRTNPTGKIGTYSHPHWAKEDPENYKTNKAEYEIHEPEQEAYGDWAPICVGGQYYLFGDYDPVGGHQMSVCWFTSSSIDKEFVWCDKVGSGHPDPDITFAEGAFYLATQQDTDYISPGPWVETVEARVGVDTTNDGDVDQWSDWTAVKESYDYIKGFAKQIATIPASLNLTDLPMGYGFRIELRLTDTTENKSKPIIDCVTLSFGE